MPEEIFIVTTDLEVEATLSLLFAKHKIFCSAISEGCKILSHKRPSKINILNWTRKKHWPNQNTNDFLKYELHQKPIVKFLNEEIEQSLDMLVYIDARKQISFLNEQEKIDFYQRVKAMTRCNLIIVAPRGSLNLSDFQPWFKTHITLLDTCKNSYLTILMNYNYAQTDYFDIGHDKADRQRVRRKNKRWLVNFMELPESERRIILSSLLSGYIDDS